MRPKVLFALFFNFTTLLIGETCNPLASRALASSASSAIYLVKAEPLLRAPLAEAELSPEAHHPASDTDDVGGSASHTVSPLCGALKTVHINPSLTFC